MPQRHDRSRAIKLNSFVEKGVGTFYSKVSVLNLVGNLKGRGVIYYMKALSQDSKVICLYLDCTMSDCWEGDDVTECFSIP